MSQKHRTWVALLADDVAAGGALVMDLDEAVENLFWGLHSVEKTTAGGASTVEGGQVRGRRGDTRPVLPHRHSPRATVDLDRAAQLRRPMRKD